MVQPEERNVFDQRALEYELLEKQVPRNITLRLTLTLIQTLYSYYPSNLRRIGTLGLRGPIDISSENILLGRYPLFEIR